MTTNLSPSALSLDSLMEEVRERIRENVQPPKWNWVEKRTVALVHIDELGNKSPLGLFIQLECSRDRSARRLVPAPPDHIYADLVTEHVTGPFWLYPQVHSCDIPTTPQELLDLKARFWELLTELNA